MAQRRLVSLSRFETQDMATAANYDYVSSAQSVVAHYLHPEQLHVAADCSTEHAKSEEASDGDKMATCIRDMDASFRTYINYTGVPDTDPSDPCNPEDMGNADKAIPC